VAAESTTYSPMTKAEKIAIAAIRFMVVPHRGFVTAELLAPAAERQSLRT
jgi:hypothetical protein